MFAGCSELVHNWHLGNINYMSDALLAAFIAGSAAVVVALLTQFAAEAYRRHREGSAVAAALAGELSAYRPAVELLRGQVAEWARVISTGNRDVLTFRPIERQSDMVFGEIVGRLGLLGADLTERVVYVYGNIKAFRVGHELIIRDHSSMDDDELLYRVNSISTALREAHDVGEKLVIALRERAHKSFLSRK